MSTQNRTCRRWETRAAPKTEDQPSCTGRTRERGRCPGQGGHRREEALAGRKGVLTWRAGLVRCWSGRPAGGPGEGGRAGSRCRSRGARAALLSCPLPAAKTPACVGGGERAGSGQLRLGTAPWARLLPLVSRSGADDAGVRRRGTAEPGEDTLCLTATLVRKGHLAKLQLWSHCRTAGASGHERSTHPGGFPALPSVPPH